LLHTTNTENNFDSAIIIQSFYETATAYLDLIASRISSFIAASSFLISDRISSFKRDKSILSEDDVKEELAEATGVGFEADTTEGFVGVTLGATGVAFGGGVAGGSFFGAGAAFGASLLLSALRLASISAIMPPIPVPELALEELLEPEEEDEAEDADGSFFVSKIGTDLSTV
jgi:hypothetical protein